MLNQIDLSRTDLNLLVLFEVVLTERHVARAAERLNLSASAVSHGLARLRRLLGDPLFLRTPKGVAPTTRALELAEPVNEVLARVRRVIATATPFDPATSTRRFTVGAPDSVSAVFLPPLLTVVRSEAPGIDLSLRQLLPAQSSTRGERAWAPALAELDSRAMDVAIAPLDDVPARFAHRLLYEEDFVAAMRAGHPFARDPSLDRYCRAQHVVVSLTGGAFGFVDEALGQHGRTRRVALTVPNFMMALAVIAETDLITAVPRRFVRLHARRFRVVSREIPVPLPRSRINAIAPKVALMDAGLAWLFDALGRAPTRGRAVLVDRRMRKA